MQALVQIRFRVLAPAIVGLLLMPGDGPSLEDRDARWAKAGYRYEGDLDRVVAVCRGDRVIVGKLNDTGKLIEDRKISPITIINMPARDKEVVYEYRGGGLIKGILDSKGNFVPELGSKVITFDDYEPGERAPRIYNLPGRFVRIKK